ncbi:tRNA lysidine(34) synthetase TilS [Neisseria lisongii]|uniref:tRNA(Ile)-lysidine synthase n=1 Tax=Neisseria lisongii TaxID=2912188 RepID=A0AAW5AKJ7_9NEIS|nr:tRNA lysidine(34) synthetase TilS [Neisseria lisongii]MCF7529669.1 tRNA lysidine(34) synthetase TilS [Neisseria lisongii]
MPSENVPDTHLCLETVAAAWLGRRPAHIEVGFSGGLDSVVLLHILVTLRQQYGFRVQAVHIHHGLNPAADDWAAFCRRCCEEWNVPLRVVRVQVNSERLGVEAAARAERYRAFAASDCAVLALAHHQNDQIETFLLAAARGGGIRALAAMPEWRALNSDIQIWRPLLPLSRNRLADYAAAHGLTYVEDDSNGDPAYLRNWLRHQALPAWRQRVAHIDRQILANVRALQDDLALLDELAEADWAQVCLGGRFSLAAWRQLSERRRRHLLHFLLQRHDIHVSRQYLYDFSRVLSEAESGSWTVGGKQMIAYRQILFIVPEHIGQSVTWADKPLTGRLKTLLQAQGFVLRPQRGGLSETVLNSDGMIRVPAATDKIPIHSGSKSVNKILQEARVLPPLRAYWPLIAAADGTCLAVANLRVRQDIQAENGWLPVWPQWQDYCGIK